MWLYGTGLPKSRTWPRGRGTALKPAWEPIILARRPLQGTTTANLAEHGTGALNIDRCRVASRHPANVLFAHRPDYTPTRCVPGCPAMIIADRANRHASRLFYSPKATRRERDAGCEHLPARELNLFPQAKHAARTARNPHPTIKPLAVMRWLVRLITPPDGLVLAPFCGSGSTGAAAMLECRRFVGIERKLESATIARARIGHWATMDPGDSPGRRTDRATV